MAASVFQICHILLDQPLLYTKHSLGPICLDFLTESKTITGAYYSDFLKKVKAAMRTKRRAFLSKGVILLQDNARPATTQLTMNTLSE